MTGMGALARKLVRARGQGITGTTTPVYFKHKIQIMKNPNNRPLGTNEKVFWALDQKSSTQFAIAAELLGNAPDDAWRAAIDIVQLRHPNLSVRISGNNYHSSKFEDVIDCKIPLRIIQTGLGEDWAAILGNLQLIKLAD